MLEVGRVKHAENGGDKTAALSTIDNAAKELKHNTRETIANDLGWSTGKVAMADKVWKEVSPEVKEKVLSGEVSIIFCRTAYAIVASFQAAHVWVALD